MRSVQRINVCGSVYSNVYQGKCCSSICQYMQVIVEYNKSCMVCQWMRFGGGERHLVARETKPGV